MTNGTEIRLHRILRKGRMLCIPMDHGISNGPIEGLEKPHSMIYKCESHGITCVIINKGIIKTLPRPQSRHFSSFFRKYIPLHCTKQENAYWFC